jgi:hypothetical protein
MALLIIMLGNFEEKQNQFLIIIKQAEPKQERIWKGDYQTFLERYFVKFILLL